MPGLSDASLRSLCKTKYLANGDDVDVLFVQTQKTMSLLRWKKNPQKCERKSAFNRKLIEGDQSYYAKLRMLRIFTPHVGCMK